MIIAGTGHRPDKLGGYSKEAFEKLVKIAEIYLLKQDLPPLVISGMALGWDQALAEATIRCGYTLHCYIPFVGQEKMWPEEAQDVYRKILAAADEVVVCGEFDPKKIGYLMQKRNERMVDAAEHILAMWDGSAGGTKNCVIYAMKQEKNITNLYPQWTYPF